MSKPRVGEDEDFIGACIRDIYEREYLRALIDALERIERERGLEAEGCSDEESD